MKRRRFITLSAWSCAAIGCSSVATIPTASVKLTLSAAASVQAALAEIQAAHRQVAPHVDLTHNLGSSGSLAQQIHQGAPSDIFLSASPRWMDDLEAQGQIWADSRRDLLQNSLVLVVPPDSQIATFTDLQSDTLRKVAMGEPNSVPAGTYAKESLTALGLFDRLQPKLVYGKDVRQVLAYVETGHVEAGLVYATDAQRSDRVKVIATAPPNSHTPITYPVAIVKDSPHPKAARDFIAFLSSAPAAAIFHRYGFSLVA
ncbi:MAG: molybdate ABC transporter substrate-binding protein [Leptolyngbyaceae cyanobacterium]